MMSPGYISQVSINLIHCQKITRHQSAFGYLENFLQSPKQKFIHTEEKLSRFLREKRPIIERALAQNAKNIFFDYSVALNEK